MPPITVDPDVLSGAGESISSVGDEIAAAVGTLASSLSGGARSGLDPAGLAFGHAYQQSAQGLLDAGAAAINAGRGIGFGIRMSATNYSRADAASTIGGGAPTLASPDVPAEFSAPASPSALGGGAPPPLLWSVIQTFIPDVWPDGDPAALRSTATAWQGFASTINGIVGQLAGPSGVVAGQQIPEGGNMTSAISELTQSLSGIASEAGKLATQTSEFADDVENTQNAIRDLLDRVSPSGLWDGIQAVFSGDALEELKEVADDIKAVLEGYGHQAEGRRDMLQIAMGMIDDAVVSVEKWARREFPRYLGDDVGNALATALDFELTLGQGLLAGGVDLVEGVGQFDPLRFTYDPEGAKDAWVGMAENLGEGMLYATPTGVLANPAGAFNHWKDQVTDAVHAEDWSSDRPGYGLGKILFDVGASVVPGGPALRTTKVAAEAADVATPGPGRIPDVPSGALDNLAPIAQRADDITTKLDNLDDFGDNVPTTPTAAGPTGPAIPPSLAEPPDAPRVADTPTPTPRGPDAPTPHVPDSTPGDRTPVPPHNSTPTGNPTQTPLGAVPDSQVPAAVDSPTAPHQTTSTPSNSSAPPSAAPPVASHPPESPPAEAPQPPTAAGPGPSASTFTPHGPEPASSVNTGGPTGPDPASSDPHQPSAESGSTQQPNAPSAHDNPRSDTGLTDNHTSEQMTGAPHTGETRADDRSALADERAPGSSNDRIPPITEGGGTRSDTDVAPEHRTHEQPGDDPGDSSHPESEISLGAEPAADGLAGSIRSVNPGGGDMNCVNCVITTDQMLDGAKVSAALDGPKPIGFLETHFGSHFTPIAGKTDIETSMIAAGDGARGVVFASQGPGQVGHVFNVVNQDGVIRFLDGQPGSVASFDGYQSYFFMRYR